MSDSVQSQQGEMHGGWTDEWFALLARVAVAATVVTASHACECEAVHAPVRIEKENNNGVPWWRWRQEIEEFRLHSSERQFGASVCEEDPRASCLCLLLLLCCGVPAISPALLGQGFGM